jgi:predicted dehydrogenase
VATLHDEVTVAETGLRIPNRSPAQIGLTGRLESGAVISALLHGGNSQGPDGFHLKITGLDGTLTITPSAPGQYIGWSDWHIRLHTSSGTDRELPIPATYRDIPDGIPSGPPANIAALYREVARAITEGRPAHPGFDTALRHHQALAAVERAAQTGTRQAVQS